MPQNFVHVFIPVFAVVGVIVMLYAIGLGNVIVTTFRKPKAFVALLAVALVVWMLVADEQ
jgi:hypothetical protein